MKMTMKKETKHTVVYETDEMEAAVSSVYVSKVWLARQQAGGGKVMGWPESIALTLEVLRG